MREFYVRVADFSFGAVSSDPALRFELTESLSRFLISPDQGCDLTFETVVEEQVVFSPKRMLFEDPIAYCVGLGESGQCLIRGWAQPGPFCVAQVAPDFAGGTLHIPAALVSAGQPFYPLERIDVVLAVNRFALTGDVLVHGAGVSDRGRGYLFVGPSGAGKSTMAGIWASAAGAVVLGEDNTVVVERGGGFWVYGAPWHSNPARCTPLGVPLSAVFVLRHGTSNSAVQCRGLEGVASVLTNCFLPVYQRAGVRAIVDNLALLGQSIPVYQLQFRPDGEIVEYIRSIRLA